MIHALDNGRDYSDHRIAFVESELTGPQMRTLLAFIGAFTDDDIPDGVVCWCPSRPRWKLIASGSLEFHEGTPGTLLDALDLDDACAYHLALIKAKIRALPLEVR